ncbi:MAG: hypothetical protein K9G11_01100 [Rickettsiaceae bacterium]|nr:hypothetical protein [Rickettsiaceae bacterium]
MSSFNLIIVGLNKFKKFDGISSLTLDTSHGQITILPGHCDFITTLQEEQNIKFFSNIEHDYNITDAMLFVRNGEVRILTQDFIKIAN